MSRRRWLFVAFIFCLGVSASQNVFAFRCDGQLVSVGQSKLTVLKHCGEPDWIDRWVEETIDFPDTPIEHRLVRVNERWLYNPGPSQFLRFVTFRDGRVVSIETGGRGFIVRPGMQPCDLSSFSLGTPSAEVAARCGEPDMAERRIETVTRPIPGGRQQVTVSIDEWTFNLGATRFMRVLTFRNGELVEIRTGEKGFD